MSQPSINDVHVDRALTDVSIAYIQDEKNFIAAQAFPIKPVPNKTNKYFIFNKNDWLRDDAVKVRAPGEAAPQSGFTLSTDSYDAQPWWTETPLDELVLSNADASLPLEQAATRLVTQRMLIRRERLFASKFFTSGVWGTDKTVSAAWDDYSSDPVKDLDVGQETVLQNTGREPNCLIVGYKVHKALQRHPIVKDKYKYTSAESITEEMIANVFELDKYLVSRAAYATNNEGGTGAYSFISGNNALLLYSDGAPSIMEPCAGAIFAWDAIGMAGGEVSAAGIAIDQYYWQKTRTQNVRGQFAFDMKVTGADLGYFFPSVVTTG